MSNTCPICFEELTEISRASTDVCDHIFCLPCLEKWSRHGTYCPVDRKRFRKIVNLYSEAVIKVKPRRQKQSSALYDVTTYCEVCKNTNNAQTLLLCDCCDLGYHCMCLTPPLEEVPAGPWYCPVCVAVESRIKILKDPVISHNEIKDQRNQEYLLVDTEASRDSKLSEFQNNRKRSEGNNNSQEYSKQEQTAASLLKHCQNNSNGGTIKIRDNILGSQINSIRSHTNVRRSQKEMGSKNLTGRDLDSRTLDIKHCYSASQSRIEQSKINNQELQDNKGIWSMRLRMKDSKIKATEGGNYSSTNKATVRQNESIICQELNKIKVLPLRLRKSNLLVKTIHHMSDDTPPNQSYCARNEINNKHEKQDKNPTFSMSLRRRDHHVNTIDIESDIPTSQKNITKSKKCRNVSQEYNKNNSLRCQVVKKDSKNITVLHTETIYTGYNYSAIKTKVMKSSSKNIHSQCKDNQSKINNRKQSKDIDGETLKNDEIFPVLQSNIAKKASEKSSEKNSKNYVHGQDQKEDDNLVWRDCYGEIICNIDDSEAIQTVVARSESEHTLNSKNDIFPLNLRKNNNRVSKDFCGETVYTLDNSSAIQTSRVKDALKDIHCIEENFKKDIIPSSLENINTKNWRDYYSGAANIEDDSPPLQTNRQAMNIQSRKENIKKNIFLQSPRMINRNRGGLTEYNRNWKDGYEKTIDIEDDSLSFETNVNRAPGTIHNSQETGEKSIILSGIDKGKNRNWKNHEERIVNKKDSPSFQTNTKKSASVSIHYVQQNCNKNIVSPSLEKLASRNYDIDLSEKIIYTEDYPTIESKVTRSAAIYSEQEHDKNDIAPLSTFNRSNKSRRNLHDKTKDTAFQTSIRKSNGAIISSCQMHGATDTALRIRKGNNQRERDLNIKITGIGDDSPTFQTHFAKSELSIQNSQEEYNKNNIDLKSVSEKNVSWDRQNKYVKDKTIPNNTVTLHPKILRSEDTLDNCQEPSRKDVITSLVKLKDSLIEESENDKANTGCSISTNKTSVKIDQDSSGIKKFSFSTKKSISNADVQNLNVLLSSKKGGKSKSEDILCHGTEQSHAMCNKQLSGTTIQSKVIPEVSSQKPTLSVEKVNFQHFNFTKAPVHNDCNINHKDKNSEKNASSQFSVFEPLEDVFISNRKYLNMNMAVNKINHSSQSPLLLFDKSFSSSRRSKTILSANSFFLKNQKPCELLKKSSSQSIKTNLQSSDFTHSQYNNYRAREVDYAIKAKMNLADELIKIEQEKWSRSLKKHKQLRLSCSVSSQKPHESSFNICETTSKNV